MTPVLLLLLVIATAANPTILADQAAALNAFFDGLGCATPTCPRLDGGDVCTPTANLNCTQTGLVGRISLEHMPLKGTISSIIGRLSGLTQLILDAGMISGTLPTELGNLSSLTDLQLDENAFRGQIPSQLGNLARLEILLLHSNVLQGGIPTELLRLSSLTTMTLSWNLLSGATPALPSALMVCDLQVPGDKNCLACPSRSSCQCEARSCGAVLTLTRTSILSATGGATPTSAKAPLTLISVSSLSTSTRSPTTAAQQRSLTVVVGLDSDTDDVGLESDTNDGTSTTIGIVVGSILAALCIVAALLLILRHRRRQRRQQAGEPRSQHQQQQQQQREVSHYSFLPTNQSQSAEAWSNHSTKGSNADYISINIQPRATQYESGNMESAGTLSSVNPDSSRHH